MTAGHNGDDVHPGSLHGILTRIGAGGGLPVLLVRHGRTALNASRCFVGRLDVPLDAEGLAQGQALARRLADLELAAVYSSPLSRAWQTAALCGPPVPVPGLAELDHGHLEGQAEATLETRWPEFARRWRLDPACATVPGGESLESCQARAMAALEDIARRHPGPAPILVVSHQLVIAAALCAMRGLPLARFREATCRNAAVNVLERTPTTWRAWRLDDVDHLE